MKTSTPSRRTHPRPRGTAAALRTTRERRGKDRCHVCVQSRTTSRTLDMQLDRSLTRAQQENQCRQLIFVAIANTLSLETDYEGLNFTAENNVDFQSDKSDVITISAGNTQSTVKISAIDDQIEDPNENIVIQLNNVTSNPASENISFAPESVTIKINDDEKLLKIRQLTTIRTIENMYKHFLMKAGNLLLSIVTTEFHTSKVKLLLLRERPPIISKYTYLGIGDIYGRGM